LESLALVCHVCKQILFVLQTFEPADSAFSMVPNFSASAAVAHDSSFKLSYQPSKMVRPVNLFFSKNDTESQARHMIIVALTVDYHPSSYHPRLCDCETDLDVCVFASVCACVYLMVMPFLLCDDVVWRTIEFYFLKGVHRQYKCVDERTIHFFDVYIFVHFNKCFPK